MKYALGNMLNGAGGLNADQLALDLQFATDKTLTARKGPSPILTRGSTGTFVGSDGLIQTAAVNAARFDHDPITLACKGLLIEEGRTNQWSASEDLGASPWSLINTTTLNSNNTTAPDGLTTADRFTVGSTTQEYGFFRNTFSFVSGTTYTISCYLKADQVTRVSIYAVTQATLPVDAYFDLTGNGSVTANASGTASIQRLSNGWYRCVITGTALASAITSVRINAATTGNSRNYVGNSTDAFWAWGAQLEAGSFPTSYIPTTTSALARSADVCSITGANFTGMYNQPEGTLFADARVETAARSANGFFTSLYNASSNEFSLRIFSNQVQITVRDGVSKDFNVGGVATNMKVAAAYSSLNNVASLNNGAIATGTASNLPAMTGLSVGSRFASSTLCNGHIAAIRYYKKRLPNAKLQALTA